MGVWSGGSDESDLESSKETWAGTAPNSAEVRVPEWPE